MNLTIKEYGDLKTIKEKMQNNKANSKEMQNFLNLLIKSSNASKIEIDRYIENIGFSSLDGFKKRLSDKKNDEDFVKGLAIIGGGILLAWLLNRK